MIRKNVRLSSKNQIVIPKELRRYASFNSGDDIIVAAIGGKLVLLKNPKNYTDFLAGLHKGIWKDADPVEYTRSLRKSWSKRKTR